MWFRVKSAGDKKHEYSGVRMANNNKKLRTALFVGVLCGIASVLIDVDHPIAYYTDKGLDARFLHTSILIISSVVLCISFACPRRLFYKKVLRRKHVTELRLGNKTRRS